MQQNQNTVLLNGIGGMGKSELLNHWVHDVAVKNKLYDSIVYISCTNGIANALENNTRLTKKLGIPPDKKDKLKDVIDALGEYENLLLVLDDLPWQKPMLDESHNDLKQLELISSHMLATSRSSAYDEVFTAIPIGTLSKKQCIELFCRHAGINAAELSNDNHDNHDNQVATIVDLAGRHTLTIELLAKTMKRKDDNAADFLTFLQDNGFGIDTKVGYTINDKSYRESIEQCLIRLFDIAGLTDDEKNIMLHLSCMDSNEFSLDKIKNWLALAGKETLTDLVAYGWIQPTQKNNDIQFCQLHQTITHAVQTAFHNTTPAQKRAALMLPVLQAMQADYQPQNHETLDSACLSSISSYAIAGLKSTPLEPEDIKRAVVSHILRFSVFLDSKGIYALGIALLEAAKKPIKTQLGENHLDYAVSLNDLAGLYQNMGEYDKALPLYKKSLAIRKTQLGENHPDYAVSLNNLAFLYQSMGEYTQALPLYKQALAIIKSELGENHPSYATSLNNLAELYRNMGEYTKALPLCQQALAIIKSELGENHPSYATSLNNLAALYVSMGEYTQALPLYEQASNIRKTQLGETHPDYAGSLNNLGGLYESMGDYDEALPLYKQALAITKAQLGEDHPDYATSLNNLAGLYYNMGEYTKALPLYEQAISIATQALGEAHPRTQLFLKNYNTARKKK